MEPIVGGTEHQGEITEAEKARLIRRKLVQAVFESHSGKDPLMQAMLLHNIKASELVEALDYKLDATAHMRDLGFPDGFQGLKVWSAAEVKEYQDWAESTPNALNLKSFRPENAKAQAAMDRDARLKDMNPLHVSPWKVKHE